MHSPWRTFILPGVVLATKTPFKMLQCVRPGLCFVLGRCRICCPTCFFELLQCVRPGVRLYRQASYLQQKRLSKCYNPFALAFVSSRQVSLLLPDLFARFAAMRSPWRTLVPPSVVFATKTVFNMLQCVNPGLFFFSPGADQKIMPIITTASLASLGRPAAPRLRPSPGPAKIPKASPSDGPPGPQNQQSLCGNYAFLCGNSCMGKGVGEIAPGVGRTSTANPPKGPI